MLHAQPSTQHLYKTLHYDFFKPANYDASSKYPLIFYLHGYNDTVKKNFNWYQNSVQSANPCFLVAPKCSPETSGGWGESWQDTIPQITKTALALLDSIIAKYSIDTNRLYIYGQSMGGFGTVTVLKQLPTRFAAAMVVCGGGDTESANLIAQTPLWFFHGSADQSVPIQYAKDLYNRMIETGAEKVRFKEYVGAGHDMWNYAPQELCWPDWIFHHSKSDTFNERPDIPISLECNLHTDQTSVVVSWNSANNRMERKNKLWYYKVLRNNLVISDPNYNTTYIIDRPGFSGMQEYKVIAVNYDFLESDTSNTASIVLSDIDFPRATENSTILYPNPSTGIVNILLDNSFKNARIEVFRYDGEKVLKQIISDNSNFSIDLSAYSKGIYFVNILADGKSSFEKVVLK
jgi:predicted esterase